jgi:hypothetical protein
MGTEDFWLWWSGESNSEDVKVEFWGRVKWSVTGMLQ